MIELESIFDQNKISVKLLNITNSMKLRSAFNELRPDVIFHAAAHKHVPLCEENPEEAIWNNVIGTKLLSTMADKYKVDYFVMVSTDKAVNPTSIMGASKRIAELYIQALAKISKTNFITVRFGNVLNSNGSVIPTFRNQIEKGGPITITHPKIERFFMSISEAVQLVLQAVTMGKSGQIFILEMGKSIRILDIAIELIHQAGLKPYEDIPINITGLRPGEKLYEELIGINEESIETTHTSIRILKSNRFSTLDELDKKIQILTLGVEKESLNDVSTAIKSIVPEYIPYLEHLKIQSGEHVDDKTETDSLLAVNNEYKLSNSIYKNIK